MKGYRYHPEIDGLKVNADGSAIYRNEEEVTLKERNNGSHITKYFYFKGKQIGLAKLVLECWKGLAPEPNQRAVHINNDQTDYHHENLKWGPKAGNTKFPPKLTKEQKEEILVKLQDGQSGNSLAIEYGVNRNTIYQLRKKEEK